MQNSSTIFQKAHSDYHVEEEWIGEECAFVLNIITGHFNLGGNQYVHLYQNISDFT